MYVCILEKLLWEAVYLPCMAKIILLTVWKINDMSLSQPGFCRAQRPSTCSTWWRSDSTSNLPLVSLTLAPVLTWFPPLLHFSLLHRYLSCPLVLLSCFPSSVDRGWMSHHLPWHVAVSVSTRGECFISAAPGMDCGSAWLGCTIPSAGAQTLRRKKEKRRGEKKSVHMSIWIYTGWIFPFELWVEWVTFQFSQPDGGEWMGVDGLREWEREKRERELVNSVWAGSLSPKSEHGGLSLLVPESAVKCPVEEMHGQQPKESQCDQHSHAFVRGGGFNKGFQMFLCTGLAMYMMCVCAVGK